MPVAVYNTKCACVWNEPYKVTVCAYHFVLCIITCQFRLWSSKHVLGSVNGTDWTVGVWQYPWSGLWSV